MGVQRRLVVPLAALAALGIAACGEEDFKNDPRPPAPIALSARIGERGVSVSPARAGAGLANITISNQTPDPARLVLEGPTDQESPEVVPNGTGALKLNLEEGDYTVSTGDGGKASKLTVGPERPSSQNQLLLP
jgi:hypothetical protein